MSRTKKTKINFKHIFKKRPQLKKNFKIKQTYLSNYWMKYLFLSKIKNLLLFKMKYASSNKNCLKQHLLRIIKKIKAVKSDKVKKLLRKPLEQTISRISSWKPHGVDLLKQNPYEKYKRASRPWLREGFFGLPNQKYNLYPWLEPLIFKRKVYRITRNRPFKRDKNPYDENKFFFYRKWLWLSHIKTGLLRNVQLFGDRIFKKYLFLPFYNYTPKSFKNKIKQLRVAYKVTEGNHLRMDFNNRLRFLSQDLNFVPMPNWAHHFVSFRDFITVSNQKTCSRKLLDRLVYSRKLIFNENKTILCPFIQYLNLATKINSSLINKNLLTEKNLSNPLQQSFMLNKKEILVEKQFNQNYKAKFGEIIHVTSAFRKHKDFFFRSELSKKIVPHNFKLNLDKNMAYMIRISRSSDLPRTHRISEEKWTRAILQIKR